MSRFRFLDHNFQWRSRWPRGSVRLMSNSSQADTERDSSGIYIWPEPGDVDLEQSNQASRSRGSRRRRTFAVSHQPLPNLTQTTKYRNPGRGRSRRREQTEPSSEGGGGRVIAFRLPSKQVEEVKG